LNVTGTVNSASPITGSESFTIQASVANSTTLSTAVTVTTSGTTLADLASDINGANVTSVSASVNSNGYLVISHSLGGVIVLKDTSGTPIADAGISSAITTGQVRAGNNSDLILSNWVAPTYTASTSAPSADPANLQRWYHSGFEADIMIHDGTTWKGYQNITNDARGFNLSNTSPAGPIFSTTEPTQQSDETALVVGDLWIDTSDLDNYPKIYRYETVSSENQWVLIDNTDQTTEDGILFADARYMGDTQQMLLQAQCQQLLHCLQVMYLILIVLIQQFIHVVCCCSTHVVAHTMSSSSAVTTSHAPTLVTQHFIQHFLQKRMHG